MMRHTLEADSARAGATRAIVTAALGLLTWAATPASGAASDAAAGPASPAPAARTLLGAFRAGPMKGVTEVVFAARRMNENDGHWYANIGYYAHDPMRKAWREGAKLCKWNLATGELTSLIDDPKGGVRDPQVSYDGRTVLFSYRKGGTESYHLYEIGVDSSGLRQITSGDFDDFEPSYLPDGDIVFVSTRCKRWVNCWLTQVAVLHRCDREGKHLRAISSNNEQDNTPWPLADGRILYTRWEYVDRSQVDYHHLWTANPDGTAQMVWYGNGHPGIVMIDAKPIAGSDKVVASFSPGHGQREHAGTIAVVDPRSGPDRPASVRQISKTAEYYDPWAFSEDCFMASKGPSLIVMDGSGREQVVFSLSKADAESGMHLHEARPILPRPREPVIPDRVELGAKSGRLALANIHEGRNMGGVKPGEITSLLVLESLPMPIHYTGGMEPISYGGTFTLERIVGTVPVEEDGSAYMELPPLRSFFFVALDKEGNSVKRMQSFLTVQPGETTSCVGCHEQRTRTPANAYSAATSKAVRRAPSAITPIADVPDVIDFPRDVQPILDALCVRCHGYEANPEGGPRAGRLILAGDRGPMYSQSYYMMTIAGLFADGRNQPRSNYPPRAIGSSASRILKMLDGTHHGAKATPHQAKVLRLWIDSGAAYPGTYAALGTGMIGHYAENQLLNLDTDWPETKAAAAAFQSRCSRCHDQPARALPRTLADENGLSFWRPSMDDPRLNTSRHILFNLSRPAKSIALLAPLARSAGGWEICRDPKTKAPAPTFGSTDDPDYRKILAMCEAGRTYLDRIGRFDMPGFRPRPDWVREMKRFGILDPALSPGDPIDVYATERRYWESLWYARP
ncbi:PD40 domain-containing protein [Aquisphaera insulae]|uniref:HzsA-related protein n=1 Tax=Aquisphaera insulae TaxID=2712864 RepID=UPI0013ED52F3|nr:PD40 domain-containing protein [Aquisphaera insulae]